MDKESKEKTGINGSNSIKSPILVKMKSPKNIGFRFTKNGNVENENMYKYDIHTTKKRRR